MGHIEDMYELGMNEFGLTICNEHVKPSTQFAPTKTHVFQKFENMPVQLSSYRPKVGDKVIYLFGNDTGIFTVKELEDKYCLIGNRKAVNYKYILLYTRDTVLDVIKIYLGQYSMCVLGKCTMNNSKDDYWSYREYTLHRISKLIVDLIKHFRKLNKKKNKVTP